ncbi:MAG: T9SS type A sorting domain-containing protein [Bacteroidetes bacterium]|nr:T9SS type A sorting domain-containing protein [Bacteroidota bacterium]
MPRTGAFSLVFLVVSLLTAAGLSAQICHSFEPGTYTHRSFKTESADSIGLAPTGNYDLVYHRIAVKVDPTIRYIAGSVTSYFRPLVSLTEMAFDLTDSLSVDSIYYHGARLATFMHTGNAITIDLPAAVSSLDSVVVFYSGVPPENGFGSFMTSTHDDTVPLLWTLSEPYGARDWLPGKMTLTDKIDSLDFYINVPEGFHAGSNGLMTDSVIVGHTVTYHWRHRYPIATYLIGMAVSNYEERTFQVASPYGNITLLNYFFPEEEADWLATDSNVAHAIQLYSALFGPYPFIREKYGHAQFGWGGGMEHQTMSFIVKPEFELINHEMAHQWFGDKLTCESWSEIWLNEGFATYLSGICYERLAPEWWYAWRTTTLRRTISGENGTVMCDDTNSVARIFNNSLSYSRGAYLLHMMRWQIGDSAFFAALKSYAADTSLVYSFSSTEALKSHFEAQSAQDLTWFFDQWYHTGGYPSYALDWSQQGSSLSMKLSEASSNPAFPFFKMKVPVKVYGRDQDTTLVLDHTSSGQEFTAAVGFAIDSIQIDPELWLISAGNTVRKLPAADAENFMQVLSNPVRDQMTIWYDSRNLNHVSISLYDMDGKKILSADVPQASGDYFTTPVGYLPAAVYVVKVTSEHKTLTQRIVKL